MLLLAAAVLLSGVGLAKRTYGKICWTERPLNSGVCVLVKRCASSAVANVAMATRIALSCPSIRPVQQTPTLRIGRSAQRVRVWGQIANHLAGAPERRFARR